MPLSVQFQEREDFEVRTLRALGGGAAVGLAVAALWRVGLRLDMGFFAVAGAALASARGDWKTRLWMLVGLIGVFGLTSLFNLPLLVEQASVGALAAGVMGALGMAWRPRPAQVVAGAVGAAAMLPLGLYVKTVMDAWLLGRMPAPSALLGYTVVALFWSVGLLAAHIRVHTSPVVAQGARLEKQLAGEAQSLVARAMVLYSQCQKEAARATAGRGRTELLGVLERMAREVFSQAEEHAGLEAQIHAVRQGDVDTQVRELRAKAAAATDAVARRQLELAASSLGEELNRVDLLERKRERLLAQLHAQVALLERARVSLVGVQGGDVASKSEQAAQLAQRLASLGKEDAGPPASPSPSSSQKVVS